MLRQDDLYVLYPPYCDVGKECYMIYINEFVKPITCGGTTRNELFSIILLSFRKRFSVITKGAFLKQSNFFVLKKGFDLNKS